MNIPDTDRLRLALMDDNDAALLFELDQDPAVMKFINGGKITTMEEIHTLYLPRMAKYRDERKGWGMWKVIVKSTNQFVGWVLVRPMNFFSENPEFDNLELGWRFKQNSWGKGYATEAAKQIQEMMLAQNEVKALSAIAVEDNLASIGVMKKLGMQYIKTYVHHDSMLGDMDVVYYKKVKCSELI
jgi:RimJ/RimL family protein N-acetyltransferase